MQKHAMDRSLCFQALNIKDLLFAMALSITPKRLISSKYFIFQQIFTLPILKTPDLNDKTSSNGKRISIFPNPQIVLYLCSCIYQGGITEPNI